MTDVWKISSFRSETHFAVPGLSLHRNREPGDAKIT